MTSTSDLWHDARNPPADPTHLSFKNKAVLVTGAYGAGLGHFAAVKYAALGANPLILAVRTQEKGEQAKASIIQKTGCLPDIFIIETLDLSSFASVKSFAERVNKRVPELHVIQHAGGVAGFSYVRSGDGWEMAVQVDLLSPVLLTLLLLPKMRDTASSSDPNAYRPHISFLNSRAIFGIPEVVAPPEDQTLIQGCNDEGKWDSRASYYLVKLATWYAVQGIADLCEGSDIVVNATCPGLCNTNMTKGLPTSIQLIMAVRYFFVGRSAEEGARTLVSATGLGKESHGRFWMNDQYPKMTPFLESEKSTKMYHETWSEILSILRDHVPPELI
ncbi:uncharacterized protein F4822DRAFT_337581 [Hypoxylon trugodes]|uniref:uncharacterized protein n=1 Tax=Hypoxylon trugodes TaxID=326681 RepID=UPI0021909DFA|nr:uncharacterized protein F4822DRAFT_337581 [Hypoxylon trugodes]KAI1385219.1 hypothetical protein F4822DRAFT_337581 [Hypoxylon trugodes]